MVVTTRQGRRARQAESARRVFETAELLEMILLEVGDSDTRTVYLSQRVNTSFKDTIDNSPKLQRMLWFRRDPPYFDDSCWRINPLFEVVAPQRLPIKYQHLTVAHESGLFRDDILGKYIKLHTIRCTDDILTANPSPPPNMILAEQRRGADEGMGGLGVICDLKRAPPKAGKQRTSIMSLKFEDHLRFGEMVEMVRKKLKKSYREHYHDV